MNFNLPGGVPLLAKGHGKNDSNVHFTGDSIQYTSHRRAQSGWYKTSTKTLFPVFERTTEDKRYNINEAQRSFPPRPISRHLRLSLTVFQGNRPWVVDDRQYLFRVPPHIKKQRLNRPFTRWRHFTTTTRILYVFAFISKIGNPRENWLNDKSPNLHKKAKPSRILVVVVKWRHHPSGILWFLSEHTLFNNSCMSLDAWV